MFARTLVVDVLKINIRGVAVPEIATLVIVLFEILVMLVVIPVLKMAETEPVVELCAMPSIRLELMFKAFSVADAAPLLQIKFITPVLVLRVLVMNELPLKLAVPPVTAPF
jgi:hypothetical protein